MNVNITVMQLIRGHLLKKVVIQKGKGDIIDYLANKDRRETTAEKVTFTKEVILNKFKKTNAYNEVIGGDIATGAVTHSTDRTTADWGFTFEDADLIGEIIDPKEFNTFGITQDDLNMKVGDKWSTIEQVKAFLDKLRPVIERMQKQLWLFERKLVQDWCINIAITANLKDSQKPFGEDLISDDSSAKNYYKFVNKYDKASYDEAVQEQLYDAFTNDQVDWENDTIGQSAPQLLISAKNIHRIGKIFSPEAVSNYTQGDNNLLSIVSNEEKMIGSYQDPVGANANDFIMIGPLAEMYMLGRNVNPNSKDGVYMTIVTTPAGGLQVSMSVTKMWVVESPIDIFFNKGTV